MYEMEELDGRNKVMLVRLHNSIFDINKADVVSFSDNSIILWINGKEHTYNFGNSSSDEYIKTKEFLLNMCPDIATDEGRNNFLNAVKYVAKLQGFKGDSVEKNNSENPN